MKAPMETAPVMDLSPQDLDNLVEALREYHAIYSPLFQRREQRDGIAVQDEEKWHEFVNPVEKE